MAKVAAKVYGDALFELRWKRTAVTSFWKRFVP